MHTLLALPSEPQFRRRNPVCETCPRLADSGWSAYGGFQTNSGRSHKEFYVDIDPGRRDDAGALLAAVREARGVAFLKDLIFVLLLIRFVRQLFARENCQRESVSAKTNDLLIQRY